MAAPDWQGLFNWSMRHQDGTRPAEPARELTEEDRRFLELAMEEYAQAPVKRMQTIQEQLHGEAAGEEAVAQQEALLEELVEIVENIDFARDLAMIGGLPTLLRLLESAQPGLRSRAAEVLATCSQANPPVQDWFLEGGVLQPLLRLASDPNDTCRTKALLALSCLVRHHGASLDAFRAAGGLRLLAAALGDGAGRAKRKALQLLREVLRERPEDAAAACDLGVPKSLAALLSRASGETGEAALALLAALADDAAACERLRQEPRLLAALEATETRLTSLDLADLEPRRDELALARHVRARLDPSLAPSSDPGSPGAPSPYVARRPPERNPAGEGRAGGGGGAHVGAGEAGAVGAPHAAAAAARAPLMLGPP